MWISEKGSIIITSNNLEIGGGEMARAENIIIRVAFLIVFYST